MNTMRTKKETFFGSTTVGERGQVVIPSEARQAMKIEAGEKLLVLGMGEDMLILAKISQLEALASHLNSRLEEIQTIIKKNSKK
jgi:AbrB family looped-hinge helix DNA binding protein